jgi:nitronate monooxygenase
MGADMAYIGSPFIATEEARASAAYKQMIVDSNAADIVYSNYFTGIHGNYLRASILAAGMDPANLPEADPLQDGLRHGNGRRQGMEGHLGLRPGDRRVREVGTVARLVDRLEQEYDAARARLGFASGAERRPAQEFSSSRN